MRETAMGLCSTNPDVPPFPEGLYVCDPSAPWRSISETKQ